MFIAESKVAKCAECREQVYVSVLAKAVEYKQCLFPCYCNSELKWFVSLPIVDEFFRVAI